jgi:hypothetical protein
MSRDNLARMFAPLVFIADREPSPDQLLADNQKICELFKFVMLNLDVIFKVSALLRCCCLCLCCVSSLRVDNFEDLGLNLKSKELEEHAEITKRRAQLQAQLSQCGMNDEIPDGTVSVKWSFAFQPCGRVTHTHTHTR